MKIIINNQPGGIIQQTDKPIVNIFSAVSETPKTEENGQEAKEKEVEYSQFEEVTPAPANNQEEKFDTATPLAKLLSFLSQKWFDSFSTDKKKYNISWRSELVKMLMSKFGDSIAKGWQGHGTRNQQDLIKCHLVGALVNSEVIENKKTDIAKAIVGSEPGANVGKKELNDKRIKKLAIYIGHRNKGQHPNPYLEWINEYVKVH